MLLAKLASHVVTHGRLTIVDHEDQEWEVGRGDDPHVRIRLADRKTALSMALNPGLAAGEAFMDGRLIIEQGTLYDFLDLCLVGINERKRSGFGGIPRTLGQLLRHLHQYNPIGRAQRNVAHHYDLSSRLYELFLDADRQYSCAYFEAPDIDLDSAQRMKKRHLAAKLMIRPGQRVLDIGCGWGGLGLYLAQTCGAEVTGVTLSAEQHRVANDRAAEAGLSHIARFELRDYRDLGGEFDRIVSVGMFEHVGVGHYQEFFDKVRSLLPKDGIALLHSIGNAEGPSWTNPWIRKYIFPGGYIPALSEVLPKVENAGLWVTDIEILRLHYAETLRAWRRRFEANRQAIVDLYDERFARMWEFYLVGSELFFRRLGGMNFQIQMARERDAAPLTRDYISDWERSHSQTVAIAAE